MCKEFDCKAYRRGFPNKCSALSDTVFTDSNGKEVMCPFYKTEKEFRDEVLRLRASGHKIDAEGIYEGVKHE